MVKQKHHKILIADSGSTKTDWRLVDEFTHEISQFSCKGLNPFHNSKEQLLAEVLSVFSEASPSTVDAIHFYGAGCSSNEKKSLIEVVLKTVFSNAVIYVNHDLLAAARAALNKQQGIVLILGTGSSFGLYDGSNVTMPIPSLGYVLGDEGSGVAIGKRVLKSYFYNQLPESLTKSFQRRFLESQSAILDQIYKGELPNKYLASFSQFAFQHRQVPFISNLIREVFIELFELISSGLSDDSKNTIAVVGSIGFYYNDFIRSVADEFGFTIGVVIEKPIAGLTIYHTALEE